MKPDYSALSDAELIELLATGDSRSWRYVYEEYRGNIIALILQKGGSREDGEDLYNEALSVLKTNIDNNKLAADSNLRNYIYTIAANRWYSLVRKKRIKTADGDNSPEPPEPGSDSEYIEAMHMIIEQGISQISEKCQGMVTDRYHIKLSTPEITEKYGLTSLGVAKTTLYNCMQRLRKIAKELLAKNEK